MLAGDFPQHLRLVRHREIFFGMRESNQTVLAAVHDEQRYFDSRQPGARIVLDAAEPAHRQPGKQLCADVRDAGVGALENQATQTLAQSQFAGHAAAERFAQRDDVRRRKTFSAQPLMRRLGIEISALLTGPSLAPAVAAIIENE